MKILSSLFDDDRQRCNWRLYHLFARLVCWAEADPSKARSRIMASAWKRTESMPLPHELMFLSSDKTFERWYNKSKGANFVQRLITRIEFSKSLRGPIF